ncbi:MAG: hypothetical protein ACRYFZ_19495 [Janthinobacterium lividum]
MALTNLDFRLPSPDFAAGESLDLSPDTEVEVEISNPLFETDTLPGALIYPFTVPNTPKNRRLLAFPGYLAATRVRNQFFVCDLYLLGVLWRRGQLSVVKRTAEGFELSFQTDVGDVSTQLTDVQLADVPMPTVPLTRTVGPSWPDRLYGLPTVCNSLFYPEKDATTLNYQGLVNAYKNGVYDTTQPLVPMPYLRAVVEQVCAYIGYSLAGTFFSDAEIQTLLLYSNQAVDPTAANVVLSQHLPNQAVPDFIKAWRALFCLSLVFDPVRKRLEVDALRDVLANPAYVDWTDRAEAVFEWEPNTSAGYYLKQTLDDDDDLSKNAPASEYELKIGGAQEEIEVDASSLSMQRGLATATALSTSPEILLPVTVQKGNSPLLPDEEKNEVSLRFLFDRGLRADAGGASYPLASAEAVNYQGRPAGNYSLRWDGPQGLYQVWHKDWLDFRARTETITRGVRLRLADLLQLDPRRKVLIRAAEGTTLAFWQSINVTISQQDGIQSAQIPFFKI